MIVSSHRQPEPSSKLIIHLQDKIGLSKNALDMGIRQAKLEQAPLPIVLWSFGLLSLTQFQKVLDWQNNQL